jgi:lysine/arginine/ornithine transport system substrate-binding protein
MPKAMIRTVKLAILVACTVVWGWIDPALAQGLRIGTEGAYPPFEYRDASGTLKGLDVEIGNALCERMRVPCQWMPQDFDGLIPAIKAGKIELIISSLSMTPDRAKVIDFTKPYYVSPSQFVALKSSGITDDPATLKGKTIGVQSGTIHQAYMEQKLPDIAEKVYNTVEEAELDLESGRIDAMLADKLLMYDWLEKAGKAKGFDYVGKPLADPLVTGKIGIGVKKGNALMVQSLNAVIDQLLADPEYDKITKAYFPFSIRP